MISSIMPDKNTHRCKYNADNMIIYQDKFI